MPKCMYMYTSKSHSPIRLPLTLHVLKTLGSLATMLIYARITLAIMHVSTCTYMYQLCFLSETHTPSL